MNYYRFSKRRFLEKFVDEGVISFGNARNYINGATLTPAQRDDEQGRSFTSTPKNGTIRATPGDGSDPITVNSVLQIDIRLGLPRYYLLCLTTCYDPSLYREFDADACIEITDIERLISRVKQQVSRTMPGWSVEARPVKYFDSSCSIADTDVLHLICSKDKRYESHAEYRVVLYNPNDRHPVDRIEVNLGRPLIDICRMI